MKKILEIDGYKGQVNGFSLRYYRDDLLAYAAAAGYEKTAGQIAIDRHFAKQERDAGVT